MARCLEGEADHAGEAWSTVHLDASLGALSGDDLWLECLFQKPTPRGTTYLMAAAIGLWSEQQGCVAWSLFPFPPPLFILSAELAFKSWDDCDF